MERAPETKQFNPVNATNEEFDTWYKTASDEELEEARKHLLNAWKARGETRDENDEIVRRYNKIYGLPPWEKWGHALPRLQSYDKTNLVITASLIVLVVATIGIP